VTARDEVAGLPGGAGTAIAAAGEGVYTADPGSITALAGKLTNAAGDADGCNKAVSGAVGNLSSWTGDVADAFRGYMGNFGSAGASCQKALSDGAVALTAVATTLTNGKSTLESKYGQVITDYNNNLKTYGTTNGHPTDEEKAAAAQKAVSDNNGAITGEINTINSQLGSDAAAIGKVTDGISPKFSTMAPPGGNSPTNSTSTSSAASPSAPPPANGSSGPVGGGGGGGGGGGSVHHHSGGGGGGGAGGGGGVGGGGAGGMGSSGGPPSSPPPGNVQEWIQEAIQVLEQNGVPASALNAQDIWTIIQHESGGNPNAVNNWDCVPLDTAILTRRGWLKHDEVQVGDQTIGYNRTLGRSEWTRIERVVHHDDAPLVRLGNSRWHATTTGNHRWLTVPRVTVPKTAVVETAAGCPHCGWPEGVRRRGATTTGGLRVHLAKVHKVAAERQSSTYAEAEFVTSAGIDTRDRLLLAAPAETEATLDVTVREAAVLGWIAGDGHVERRRHAPSMSVAQSKPQFVATLRDLLAELPHATYVDDRGGRGPRHQFRLDPRYAQDLLSRAGHPKANAVEQVLAMSTAQRTAWLEAITDAEGTAGGPVYQAPGAVLDAIVLATYLSGRRPRLGVVNRLDAPESWAPERWVRANSPFVTGGHLTKEDGGRGDVWCVTTELGTWTAREDDHVFLTGNSNAQAGHPSKGLMQCIDSTFNAHSVPGHTNIYNPVDNIVAGVRYAISRYGSIQNVPGIVAVSHGGHYVGY
jgi:uncharacterized protein YukE